MKALSVIEVAKLYGLNRQSIYKRINKGDLSKNSDGKIDLSEAIRVFGEPGQRDQVNVTQLQSTTVQKSAELDIVRQQVDILQKQLELAQEREQFQREQLKAKDEQIESLQRLLGAPKPPPQQPQHEQIDELKIDLVEPNVKVQVTEDTSFETKKKRGLFKRLIREILN